MAAVPRATLRELSCEDLAFDMKVLNGAAMVLMSDNRR